MSARALLLLPLVLLAAAAPPAGAAEGTEEPPPPAPPREEPPPQEPPPPAPPGEEPPAREPAGEAPPAAGAPEAKPAGEKPAAPPPAEEAPGRFAIESGGERVMEFSGGIEAGIRAVTGKEGRYWQDVNLDGGFRLLSAEVRGNALRDGLFVDTVALSLVGAGDPNRRFSLEARDPKSWDLRLHSDRQEYESVGDADLHPSDTTRWSDGGSLSLRPWKGLEVRLTTEHLRRDGDAGLTEEYQRQYYPAPATIEYDGWFHSAGFDGSSGAFRFGGTWAWSAASDESVRTLRKPDTPVDDTGPYRTDSDIRTGAATGRAGLRLLGGKVDLSVLGGYASAETDTEVEGDQEFSSAGPDGIDGTADDVSSTVRTDGDTEARSRSPWWRAELLVLPHADWEVLARYEDRRIDEDGGGTVTTDDSLLGFPLTEDLDTSTESTLRRTGLEARWRASRVWRFRGGVERVDEDATYEYRTSPQEWSPETTVGTAGIDVTPSDRFDASVLGRYARGRDPATALSTEDGGSLSVRLRARRPDGWHAEGFGRIRQRRNGDADASSTVDSYGFSMGFAGKNPTEWMEFSVSRQDFTMSSDTAFVVNYDPIAGGVRTPQRVRYDEAVTSATLDFSQPVHGPVRLFASARWSDGNGDTPWDQYDAALGLGWRVRRDTEIRAEARAVVYNESDGSADDYAARIYTVSVLWEF